MIKSTSYDQAEILQSIVDLHCPEGFDADITYGNGQFYKNVKEPKLKFDIQPLMDDVVEACSTNLPLENNSIASAVFDPPFLTYIKAGREHNSIMAKRFSGYYTYAELEKHYDATLNEAHRVLKDKGILVFKCQDIIHNHKMHSTHNSVINWANQKGFRLKDLFILCAKNRMQVTKGQQKHARIFHSYFLVFEKIKEYYRPKMCKACFFVYKEKNQVCPNCQCTDVS